MDLNQFKSPGVYTIETDYWIPKSNKPNTRILKISKIFNLDINDKTGTHLHFSNKSKPHKMFKIPVNGPSNQPVMITSIDEFKKHFQ